MKAGASLAVVIVVAIIALAGCASPRPARDSAPAPQHDTPERGGGDHGGGGGGGMM
ncbi:MAG: hypothetical protein ACREFI_00215 [Stellaceae bacterium]